MKQQKVNTLNMTSCCVPYLVVHPEANDLGQEGPCKASSDQLFVGPPQCGLIQALPHDATRKLIHFQSQVGRPVSVRVHLENRGGISLLKTAPRRNFECGSSGKSKLSYKTLVVVAEAGEQLVGGIKKGLTNQLKPLPARPSPVQSCGEKSKV